MAIVLVILYVCMYSEVWNKGLETWIGTHSLESATVHFRLVVSEK